MQIDPNTVTWDAPPKVIPPEKGRQQGGVIITDPTVQSEEERKARDENRADRTEARQAGADTWAVMSPEEVSAAGLDPGIVWQRNGLGEMKAVPGQREASSEKGGDRATKLQTLLSQLDRVEELYQQNLKGGFPGPIAGRVPGVIRPENDQFNSASAALAEQGLSAFRVPGIGSQSDAELRQFVEANRPRSTDTDLAIEEKLRALRARAEAELKSMGPTPWQQPEQPQVTGEGNSFLTEQDRELQDRLREAYGAGASLADLKAIAAEYNAPFPIATEEELQKARKEGRQIQVNPSGRKTAAEEALGGVADSEAGAYAISAANALTSGLLDELVGALGGDAETAEAAKQVLRDRYAGLSLAGEVSGQAISLALGGAAAKGLGVGARALPAIEAAQGAAYGAGDTNDNRLLGAGIGAGATVAGQQIAKRLLEPGARAILSRAAQERGIPEDVLTKVAADALDGTSAPLEEAAQTEAGKIARRALGAGPGSKSAREQLAIMAAVNPEAKAAAERLGIELPPDILSDSAQLKTLTGLARSQIGSEAQASWGQAVTNVMRNADEALEELGATQDLAQVGADVMDRLESSAASLERQGAELRRQVDEAIDVRDRVEGANIKAAIEEVVADMGGGAEGRAALSGEEKKLLGLFGRDGKSLPTYARLNQMRDEIGRALFKGQGPWADTAQANLSRYYGALADDQLAYVAAKGGEELANTMRASNSLFSRMYDTRRSMQAAFGAKLERDLPPLISRAITGAQKGDAQALRKLLESVPEDMRSRVVLSGIMANAGRRSAGGGFSFAQYAKMYRGLRENGPVYKRIADAVGPDAARVMGDLYAISRRMAEAEGKIVRTGASTQPLIASLNAENLIARLMKGTARRAAVTGAAAATGGVAGGPVGGALGASVSEAMQDALAKGGKSRLEKLHTLLSSDAFRELMEKTGGEAQEKALARVAGSKEYNSFAARVLGLRTPEERKDWLRRAFVSGAVQTGLAPFPNNAGDAAIEIVP